MINLIFNALPFGRLWYGEPDAAANAVGYAKFCSRSHNAVIRVGAGNFIEAHEHAGEISKIDDDYRAKCLDTFTCLQ
jgi:hypothetical protein